MNLAIRASDTGPLAPKLAGARPHVLPMVSAMWLLAAVASGCSSSDSQVTAPNIVGMTNTTPPYYQDGETTIYEVQLPVLMPMRQPDATEAKALAMTTAPAFNAAFGATTMPWILADDVQTTIRFTITNLDDTSNTLELLVDPWNPYVKYKPGVEIISDEETLPDLSGYDRYYVLGPKERLIGTLTPDDTRELAIDLATVMNISVVDPTDMDGNALYNHTFNLQNRSNDPLDLLIAPYIPQANQVAAMIGFDLGLRSLAPMNVAVEVTVDVQDITGHKVMPTTGPNMDNVAIMAPGATLAPPKVVPEAD